MVWIRQKSAIVVLDLMTDHLQLLVVVGAAVEVVHKLCCVHRWECSLDLNGVADVLMVSEMRCSVQMWCFED